VDKFRQRYRLHLPALRQLIQQRNCQALAHEVHSLKSSVAYVGAFDLSDSCAELESLLNKPGQIPDSAAILCNQLANLVDELLLVTLRRQADTPVSRDFSRKNLYETLLEILPLLETSNFLVEEYFGALQELAANTDYVAAVSKLKALVDDVEYEAAVEHLKQLLPGMAESEQSAHQ
jgi:HPt (histidine-containing phosphotransfer) domain-containing protein